LFFHRNKDKKKKSSYKIDLFPFYVIFIGKEGTTMEQTKKSTIVWKESMSAKDYLSVKSYEWAKEESEQKQINYRYKIEK
jgi:hypothetical protein